MYLSGAPFKAAGCTVRRSGVVKLQRQRTPSAGVTGHLLDDTISCNVTADDVTSRPPAACRSDNEGLDDVDEDFRDAVYRSVKRSTLTERRRLRGVSLDRRGPETVVYRPTTTTRAASVDVDPRPTTRTPADTYIRCLSCLYVYLALSLCGCLPSNKQNISKSTEHFKTKTT